MRPCKGKQTFLFDVREKLIKLVQLKMGLKLLQSNYTNPLPCVKQPNKLISKHLSVLHLKNKHNNTKKKFLWIVGFPGCKFHNGKYYQSLYREERHKGIKPSL